MTDNPLNKFSITIKKLNIKFQNSSKTAKIDDGEFWCDQPLNTKSIFQCGLTHLIIKGKYIDHNDYSCERLRDFMLTDSDSMKKVEIDYDHRVFSGNYFNSH
ncbi:hypothetical protein RF11_08711 [Thelohanellus kitauei]|uniref:Uncharacterized protein n=1 Tax=Thelohanellus kitauei TaxID=669202 RepID=A0A0C2NFQ3_THEKT|nr:hypothetical protein RF11_08711 [Thelohanellus kitauei]